MLLEIDAMPSHLVEYLYLRHVEVHNKYADCPEILHSALAIKVFGESEADTVDYFFGPIPVMRQLIIKKKYQGEFDFVFSNLVSDSVVGRLITTNRIGVTFFANSVLLECGAFSTTENIADMNIGLLKVILKNILSEEAVDIADDVMDVMNEYTAIEQKRAKTRMVLHSSRAKTC